MSKIAIYRFFADPAHADAMENGYVWLSTLARCRAYEGEQGDSGEAIHSRTFGQVQSADDPENFRRVVAELGIEIDSRTNMEIVGGDFRPWIKDAYVVCCAHACDHRLHMERFGRHCVRISDAEAFGIAVHDAFNKQAAVADSRAQSVVYADRTARDLNDWPAKIGFVKPRRFAAEHEYRLLIQTEIGPGLEPKGLQVDAIRALCRRVS